MRHHLYKLLIFVYQTESWERYECKINTELCTKLFEKKKEQDLEIPEKKKKGKKISISAPVPAKRMDPNSNFQENNTNSFHTRRQHHK